MIQQATAKDVEQVAILAQQLWPSHSVSSFMEEMQKMVNDEQTLLLLAYEGREAIGFAQCSLRVDYVEGTDSTPVGYLEGIYVKEAYRHRQIARQLVEACEEWAKSKNCHEFASDTELGNEASITFHQSIGFKEANRIVCFVKKLT